MATPTRSSALTTLVRDQLARVAGTMAPHYLRLSRQMPVLLLSSGLLASLEWLHRESVGSDEDDVGRNDRRRAARQLMNDMTHVNGALGCEEWIARLRAADLATYRWHALRAHEASAWRKSLAEILLDGGQAP